MPLWGRFRISFDSWSLISLDNHVLEEAQEIGDVNVETDSWKPIKGKEIKDIRIGFVDGVRRTENIVYLEDPNDMTVVEGAFVSIGAGALVLDLGRINSFEEALKNAQIKRYFLLRDKIEIGTPTIKFVVGKGEIRFKVDTANKELSPYVNDLMADLEMQVSETIYMSKEVDLLITDGTLHSKAKVKSLPFVGYIKKHRKIYLYPEHIEVLRKLKVGERTPIVLIHSQPTTEGKGLEQFDKFTWYIKLNDSEGLSSIARLEVPANLGIERTIEIANITATLIPKFASTEFNERRAPHNLLPIKYLENYLRRRLGSQSLIRRLIAEYMLRRQ